MKLGFIEVLIAVLIMLTACSNEIPEQESVLKPETEQSEIQSEVENPVSEELFLKIKDEYVPYYGMIINCDSVRDAYDIPTYMYMAWWYEHLIEEVPEEERYEKYSVEGVKGFCCPIDEYEATVTKYFNVDAEYLRGGDEYLPEKGVYAITGVTGRFLYNYIISLENIEDLTVDGDIAVAKLTCYSSFDLENIDPVYGNLYLDISGEDFKYLRFAFLDANGEEYYFQDYTLEDLQNKAAEFALWFQGEFSDPTALDEVNVSLYTMLYAHNHGGSEEDRDGLTFPKKRTAQFAKDIFGIENFTLSDKVFPDRKEDEFNYYIDSFAFGAPWEEIEILSESFSEDFSYVTYTVKISEYVGGDSYVEDPLIGVYDYTFEIIMTDRGTYSLCALCSTESEG